MILVDANGVPFERPRREDFADVVDYIRAFHAYRDSVASYAAAEFADAFTKAMLQQKREAA